MTAEDRNSAKFGGLSQANLGQSGQRIILNGSPETELSS
jgi:hypothetical protein